MDNNNSTADSKQSFWSKFWLSNSQTVGNSELHSSVRREPAEYITENYHLKKELKQAKDALIKAQARATSYAVIIEHKDEQLKELKERFQ
jgi:hypothetical protein